MKPSGQGNQTVSPMDRATRDRIIRNYEFTDDVKDFVEKHGMPNSRNRWYSEFGTLKIK